jgi:hypothetical protein
MILISTHKWTGKLKIAAIGLARQNLSPFTGMFQGFLACEELVCNLQSHKVSNDVVGKKL